jgi:murein DD-endopeptidase MepM/ murein hydrolase activator NlpD
MLKLGKYLLIIFIFLHFGLPKAEAQFTTISPFGTIKSGQPVVQSAIKPVVDSTIDLKQARAALQPSKAEKLKMGFSYPIVGQIWYSSGYGLRFHPILKQLKLHAGVDTKAYYEPVLSIAGGIVKTVAWGEKEGFYIVITHGDFESVYAHLSRVLVQPGQLVTVGEIIAISGNTGMSSGAHLHFGMKYKGVFIDPKILLDKLRKFKFGED